MSNFMKIRPAGAELSHAVALLNFANAPENVVRNSVHSIMVSISFDHVTNTANSGLPL